MAFTDLVRRIGVPVQELGGSFMLDAATLERGERLHLDLGGFYAVGRGGVLGDVSPVVVAAVFVFFPAEFARASWIAGRRTMTPAAAAAEFAEACREWGRSHLTGADGLTRLCELGERVIAHADPAGKVLFAGWRAAPLPDDLPGRASQLLHVLREHRGGGHALAVINSGLTPLEAVIANSGPAVARLFGWPEPYPDPAPLAARVAAADMLTDEIAVPAYSALSAGELEELAKLVESALDVARSATG